MYKFDSQKPLAGLSLFDPADFNDLLTILGVVHNFNQPSQIADTEYSIDFLKNFVRISSMMSRISAKSLTFKCLDLALATASADPELRSTYNDFAIRLHPIHQEENNNYYSLVNYANLNDLPYIEGVMTSLGWSPPVNWQIQQSLLSILTLCHIGSARIDFNLISELDVSAYLDQFSVTDVEKICTSSYQKVKSLYKSITQDSLREFLGSFVQLVDYPFVGISRTNMYMWRDSDYWETHEPITEEILENLRTQTSYSRVNTLKPYFFPKDPAFPHSSYSKFIILLLFSNYVFYDLVRERPPFIELYMGADLTSALDSGTSPNTEIISTPEIIEKLTEIGSSISGNARSISTTINARADTAEEMIREVSSSFATLPDQFDTIKDLVKANTLQKQENAIDIVDTVDDLEKSIISMTSSLDLLKAECNAALGDESVFSAAGLVLKNLPDDLQKFFMEVYNSISSATSTLKTAEDRASLISVDMKSAIDGFSDVTANVGETNTILSNRISELRVTFDNVVKVVDVIHANTIIKKSSEVERAVQFAEISANVASALANMQKTFLKEAPGKRTKKEVR